jgi:hypothetical protein
MTSMILLIDASGMVRRFSKYPAEIAYALS